MDFRIDSFNVGNVGNYSKQENKALEHLTRGAFSNDWGSGSVMLASSRLDALASLQGKDDARIGRTKDGRYSLRGGLSPTSSGAITAFIRDMKIRFGDKVAQEALLRSGIFITKKGVEIFDKLVLSKAKNCIQTAVELEAHKALGHIEEIETVRTANQLIDDIAGVHKELEAVNKKISDFQNYHAGDFDAAKTKKEKTEESLSAHQALLDEANSFLTAASEEDKKNPAQLKDKLIEHLSKAEGKKPGFQPLSGLEWGSVNGQTIFNKTPEKVVEILTGYVNKDKEALAAATESVSGCEKQRTENEALVAKQKELLYTARSYTRSLNFLKGIIAAYNDGVIPKNFEVDKREAVENLSLKMQEVEERFINAARATIKHYIPEVNTALLQNLDVFTLRIYFDAVRNREVENAEDLNEQLKVITKGKTELLDSGINLSAISNMRVQLKLDPAAVQRKVDLSSLVKDIPPEKMLAKQLKNFAADLILDLDSTGVDNDIGGTKHDDKTHEIIRDGGRVRRVFLRNTRAIAEAIMNPAYANLKVDGFAGDVCDAVIGQLKEVFTEETLGHIFTLSKTQSILRDGAYFVAQGMILKALGMDAETAPQELKEEIKGFIYKMADAMKEKANEVKLSRDFSFTNTKEAKNGEVGKSIVETKVELTAAVLKAVFESDITLGRILNSMLAPKEQKVGPNQGQPRVNEQGAAKEGIDFESIIDFKDILKGLGEEGFAGLEKKLDGALDKGIKLVQSTMTKSVEEMEKGLLSPDAEEITEASQCKTMKDVDKLDAYLETLALKSSEPWTERFDKHMKALVRVMASTAESPSDLAIEPNSGDETDKAKRNREIITNHLNVWAEKLWDPKHGNVYVAIYKGFLDAANSGRDETNKLKPTLDGFKEFLRSNRVSPEEKEDKQGHLYMFAREARTLVEKSWANKQVRSLAKDEFIEFLGKNDEGKQLENDYEKAKEVRLKFDKFVHDYIVQNHVKLGDGIDTNKNVSEFVGEIVGKYLSKTIYEAHCVEHNFTADKHERMMNDRDVVISQMCEEMQQALTEIVRAHPEKYDSYKNFTEAYNAAATTSILDFSDKRSDGDNQKVAKGQPKVAKDQPTFDDWAIHNLQRFNSLADLKAALTLTLEDKNEADAKFEGLLNKVADRYPVDADFKAFVNNLKFPDTATQAAQDEFRNKLRVTHDNRFSVAGKIRNENMTLDTILENAAVPDGKGESRFILNTLKKYFNSVSDIDRRSMFSALIRYYEEPSSAIADAEGTKLAASFGALLKGAGPIMQKMLQGFTFKGNPVLDTALKDMKSNLAPIADEVIQAQLLKIVNTSGGKIKGIKVEKSLGAASVGQALLCSVDVGEEKAREVVVKILRPDVINRALREADIFRASANEVSKGIARTFEGRLNTIMKEMDFTVEAKYVEDGAVYNKPFETLKSMKVSDLAPVMPGVMMLERAPGETVASITNEADLLLKGNGILGTEASVQQLMDTFVKLEAMQTHLTQLSCRWVTEGLYGSGFYHGDLHAGNIMEDGKRMTVIDFGNAVRLSEEQRKHIMHVMCGAAISNAKLFCDHFKLLLPEASRRDFDRLGADKVVEAVLQKSPGKEATGKRIAAALVTLQKMGIEIPPEIYNFSQCQKRLQDTLDGTNSMLESLKNAIMGKVDIDAGIDSHKITATILDPNFKNSDNEWVRNKMNEISEKDRLVKKANLSEIPDYAGRLRDEFKLMLRIKHGAESEFTAAQNKYKTLVRELDAKVTEERLVQDFHKALIALNEQELSQLYGKEVKDLDFKELHSQDQKNELAKKVASSVKNQYEELKSSLELITTKQYNKSYDGFLECMGAVISDNKKKTADYLGVVDSVKIARQL